MDGTIRKKRTRDRRQKGRIKGGERQGIEETMGLNRKKEGRERDR